MSDILGERDPAIPDRPTKVAEPARETRLPKRFYKSAIIRKVDADTGFHFEVLLDGKPVRTPGRAALALSNLRVMERIGAEWAAQGERIDPMKMPITRLANTAIDGVSNEMQAVKEDIVRYAGTDLLCYRASGPEPLCERQRDNWDPILDWAQAKLGARFELIEGIMHQPQSAECMAAMNVHVGQLDDPLLLSAAHVVTSLTGSAILSLAVLKGHCTFAQAWELAHLDEDWNAEQWGDDEEAATRRAVRFVDMTAAGTVIEDLCLAGVDELVSAS